MAARRASELAQRQFAAIARRQLLAVGFTPSRITRWVDAGRLFPAYPGVYAYGRADLSEAGEHAAALLFAGGGSCLTGLSTLWWLGYLHRRPSPLHVDAPGRARSRRGLRVHHPDAIRRHLHRGLPVADLARALLLASEDLTHDSLRLVLARAEFEGGLDLAGLQPALEHGPRGARAIRAAMNAHLPQLARCANGPERQFVLLCERFGLPIPEPNARVGRYRPDMLWRSQRLIVELDGDAAHSTPAQLTADADRQRHLESLGYTVLRYRHREVGLEPALVAAAVRSRL